MNFSSLLIGLLFGATLGGLIAWLLVRARALLLGEQVRQSEQQLAQARAELEGKNNLILEASKTMAQLEATLEHERKAAEEKLALLKGAREELEKSFQALSAEALKDNNDSFLKLAKTAFGDYQNQAKSELEKKREAIEHLVTPLQQSLKEVNEQIHELENTRKEAYGSITTQLKSLLQSEQKLQSETGKLVKALREPTRRGQWGEIQLHRVVEYAGMLPHCDFIEQASVTTEEGRLRPDLIVNLPGGKKVVVDAKAPLQALLEAMETDDEQVKSERLKDHAKHIRKHMADLSSKDYCAHIEPTPDFVILFLPQESLFHVAYENDPQLMEDGISQGVFLASPLTLIALLRAIHYGWHQEMIAEKAQEIADLGRDLYDRIRTLADHFANLGKGLDKAVESYNKAVGSLESRVLISARQFTKLGAASKEEIPALEPIEKSSRSLQAPELINGSVSAKKKEEETES